MKPSGPSPLAGRRHFAATMAIGLLSLCMQSPALSHGVKAGALKIDHPYSTPTLPGQTTGAVYFRTLANTGSQPERLLRVTTPQADRVEIHTMQMDGEVMRMRAVATLDLPPNSETPFRHGSTSGYHLMLLGLKNPLKEGDRFAITLQFEKAGAVDAVVWVQQPRDGQTKGAGTHQH